MCNILQILTISIFYSGKIDENHKEYSIIHKWAIWSALKCIILNFSRLKL